MSNVWVCKQDGTIQCDETSIEITLAEMRKELALIIGEENILCMEKKLYPTVKMCFIPTGQMNAYEITERGWYILTHGIMGPQGFVKCHSCCTVLSGEVQSFTEEETNIGAFLGTLTSSIPCLIRELIGHPVRVYKTGDALTKDYRPNRFNVETNNGLIVNVWFG